jgi:hypothetical protein
MRVGFSLVILLLFVLIPFSAMTAAPTDNGFTLMENMDSLHDATDVTLEKNAKPVPVPGPDLGNANWSSNHFQNPGFEDWSSAYISDGWTVTKTGDRHQWIETTQVSQGSYSSGFQCQNYPDQFEHATLEQSSINADFSNITLSFDWYLAQNENPSQDVMFAEAQLQDGVHTFWLFYYLNGSSGIDQNSTWEGYFIYNLGPSKQWNSLSRNLTADFLSVSTLQASYSENLYVDNIRFHLESFGGSNQLLRGFIDNVKLLNETNNYYFINETIRNGGFETGDFTSWTVEESTDSGQFERSSMAYSGSFSANLTAYSVGNYSEVSFRDYPYTRLTSAHQGHVSIWWNLSDQNLTSDTYAYIAFQAYDGAAERDIVYLLSYGGTTSPLSNSSTRVVLEAEYFNTTGSWNHLDVNLWADASSHFLLNELMIRYVEVVVIAKGPEALLNILVDSVSFQAATLNPRDFEDQPAVGQRVQGFTITYSKLTVTASSYSGSKAANLSVVSGSISPSPPRLPLQWRPLNSSRETYLDVMWYLYPTTSTNQVWFRLLLSNGYVLNYYMNGLTTATANSSSIAYYNVTGAGTTGSWIQMHRDLVHDYEAAFGSLPDTRMDELYLRAATSDYLQILFDDLYLYDDPAPTISDVGHAPVTPDTNELADVTADVIDQDLEIVTLFYRVDGGGWENVIMTQRSGDTYNGTIPSQNHNAVVEYYLTANDTWGLTTTALDGTGYWTYTVTDQTAPNIDTVTQTPIIVNYLDPVNITAEITETGSGLQSIETYYRIDGGIWQSSSMTSTGYTGYFTIIGQQSYNTLVEYYINATDNVNLQGISGTFSYTVTDTVPPAITNVEHTPITVEYPDSPTVRCNVTDIESGVATVMVYYRVDGSEWNVISMTPTTGTGFAGVIPAQVWNTQVEYYVNATDQAGTWAVDDNSGTYYSYTVGDSVDPQISNIGRTPSTVEYFNSPVINCDATDGGSGVATVTLYYRVNSGGWSSISMAWVSGTRFEGNIPAHSWNAAVEYYIVVVDNAGNSITDDNLGSYYGYTVVDNVDPVLQNVAQNLSTVQYNDTVEVSCTASDVGSGIAGLTLHYRNNTGSWYLVTMSSNGTHYLGNIPTHQYDAFVEYYVTATDNAGNSMASSTFSYTVHDDYNPEILNVAHWPTVVSVSDSPEVSCDVFDEGSGVGAVTLYYRFNGINPFTATAMIHQGSGQYNATIPQGSWGDLVEYYIMATDNEGNTITDDFGGLYYSYTIGDNLAPIIDNVECTPIDVEPDDIPLIECDVTDAGSGVHTVLLFYRVGTSGPFTPISMTHTGLGHYTANIPSHSYGSTIQYYINATDWADNTSYDPLLGTYYSYTVVDVTAPTIQNVVQTPTIVEYFDTVTIECNVTDAVSGITSVVLYYWTNGMGPIEALSMTHIGGGKYTATIPALTYPTSVDYYINATDNAGNWLREPSVSNYSYTVEDNTDPEITNLTQTPTNVEYDDAVQIDCDASDSGSNIATVKVAYRLNGGSWIFLPMTNTTLNHYQTTIPVQSFGTLVEYYINATDTAGNWILDDNSGSFYSYTVSDFTGPIISNITQTPISVNYTQAPLIGCDASDAVSSIAQVRMYYRVNGESWNYLIMVHTTGNHYEVNIPAQLGTSFVEYYVNATDSEGNGAIDDNAGSYYSYLVTDNIDPVITNIDRTPVNVEYFDTPTIDCDVIDSGSGITDVLLVYRIDRGIWTAVTMVHTTGTHYEYSFPLQSYDTVVEYFINATDNAGNWAVADNSGNYFKYTVDDTVNPVSSITTPLVNATLVGSVTIEIDATDIGSGIASIVITVDGNEIAELTAQPYSYSWDTTTVIDGVHSITVTISDNAGNQAILSIDVTVHNAPTPPIPGYPFEAIVLGLLLTLGTILYIRFRRRPT